MGKNYILFLLSYIFSLVVPKSSLTFIDQYMLWFITDYSYSLSCFILLAAL